MSVLDKPCGGVDDARRVMSVDIERAVSSEEHILNRLRDKRGNLSGESLEQPQAERELSRASQAAVLALEQKGGESIGVAPGCNSVVLVPELSELGHGVLHVGVNESVPTGCDLSFFLGRQDCIGGLVSPRS